MRDVLIDKTHFTVASSDDATSSRITVNYTYTKSSH